MRPAEHDRPAAPTRRPLTVPASARVVAYAITFVVAGALVGWQVGRYDGVAVALVLAIVVPLLLAEREDGRVDRPATRSAVAPRRER